MKKPEGAQFPYWAVAQRSAVDVTGGGTVLTLRVPIEQAVYFDLYDWNKILQLRFLTEDRGFEKEEESSLKGTDYELLVVIANQGYTDVIMDAARKANATGGTVIHAKGTGMEKAEKFLGVSLAQEKEMIFMVTKTKDKNGIMQSIMKEAGIGSKAGAIVFSLPVTETAGMRLIEKNEDD